MSADTVPWIVERISHVGSDGAYLEFLLCVGVAHAALLDHRPKCGVVEVVDMAWGVSHDAQRGTRR